MIQWPWKQVSDEEFIQRMRRSLEILDRWRYWFIALYSATLIAFLFIFVVIVPRFFNQMFVGNIPWAHLGFVSGLVLGVSIAQIAHNLVHGLLMLLFGYRTERLLITLYDVLLSKEPAVADAGEAHEPSQGLPKGGP